MRPRSTTELLIICATSVLVLALLMAGLRSNSGSDGKPVVLVIATLVIGAGVVALFRHLTVSKRVQAEVTGGEQYRRLAEEYRRLADLAITAQEHTDLKLGEVSAQLDHLREQSDSLQKILKEVE